MTIPERPEAVESGKGLGASDAVSIPASAEPASPASERQGDSAPGPPKIPPIPVNNDRPTPTGELSEAAVSAVVEQKPASTDHATVPETPAEEAPSACGYEHEAQKRWPVYYLGLAMIATALFGLVPAVLDIVEHFRAIDSPGISRWAISLLLICGIQLAYAIYIMQIPDWATVWVASLVTLLIAAGYAMLLGFSILAKEDSQVIQILGLTDKLYANQATGWCLIMLSISILLAYFGGRISVRWHHTYRLVTDLDVEP